MSEALDEHEGTVSMEGSLHPKSAFLRMILMDWQDLRRNLRLWDMRIEDCFNGLKDWAYVNIPTGLLYIYIYIYIYISD